MKHERSAELERYNRFDEQEMRERIRGLDGLNNFHFYFASESNLNGMLHLAYAFEAKKELLNEDIRTGDSRVVDIYAVFADYKQRQEQREQNGEENRFQALREMVDTAIRDESDGLPVRLSGREEQEMLKEVLIDMLPECQQHDVDPIDLTR